MILDFVRLKGKSICLRVITPHELEGKKKKNTPFGNILDIVALLSELFCIAINVIQYNKPAFV